MIEHVCGTPDAMCDTECMERAAVISDDALRYRWLRDRAGNAIMKKLMKECRSDRWDELIDRERGAVSATEKQA